MQIKQRLMSNVSLKFHCKVYLNINNMFLPLTIHLPDFLDLQRVLPGSWAWSWLWASIMINLAYGDLGLKMIISLCPSFANMPSLPSLPRVQRLPSRTKGAKLARRRKQTNLKHMYKYESRSPASVMVRPGYKKMARGTFGVQ